jgi:hypothetical protein
MRSIVVLIAVLAPPQLDDPRTADAGSVSGR